MIRRLTAACTAAFALAAICVSSAQAPAQPAPVPTAALSRANLATPRPKAPFDLTGVWLHGGGADNSFRFSPPAGFVSPVKVSCSTRFT